MGPRTIRIGPGITFTPARASRHERLPRRTSRRRAERTTVGTYVPARPPEVREQDAAELQAQRDAERALAALGREQVTSRTLDLRVVGADVDSDVRATMHALLVSAWPLDRVIGTTWRFPDVPLVTVCTALKALGFGLEELDAALSVLGLEFAARMEVLQP